VAQNKTKSKDAQTLVDQRKREQELAKLKERLVKAADKPVPGGPGLRATIRIVNPLPPARAPAAGRPVATLDLVRAGRGREPSYISACVGH
jgi:hypothetical protein